jgi:hypothetical protein
MATRGTARSVKERGRTRRLDDLEDSAPSSDVVTPSPAQVRAGKAESAAPDRAPTPLEESQPRPPLDVEASHRELEARQAAWFEYREEWMRRKRARTTSASSMAGASEPAESTQGRIAR